MKSHIPPATPGAQPPLHQRFLLPTSKMLFSCYSKELRVFVPVPCLGPTRLVVEILIKSCSAFMSNMLQWTTHLSDAGIASLVLLTASKQLVQGSARTGMGAGWKPRGVAAKSSASPLMLLMIAVAGFQLMPWENDTVGLEIRENVLKPLQAPPHGWLVLLCTRHFI